MRSVPRDANTKSIDPLEFMQAYIDNEGMPKRDRLLASAQLAPYKHSRRTGQYISKALVLPEPENAQQAQSQIAMIMRISREGGCTMDEAKQLIEQLEAYVRVAATVELVPRIAALEQAAAARGDQPETTKLVIESSLPRLPGCENLLLPGQVRDPSDERNDAGQQIDEARKDNSAGDAGDPDHGWPDR
jgi:hypothetical protein